MAGQVLQESDKIEVKAHTQFDEQVGITRMWYNVVGIAAPAPDEDDVLSTVEVMYPPNMINWICVAASYVATTMQTYRAVTNELFVARESGAGAGIGLGGAHALPRQTSGLITLQTPRARASNRGRTYMPFPGYDAGEDAKVPTARHLALLTAWAAIIIADIPVAGAGGGACVLQPSIMSVRRLADGTRVRSWQRITSTRINAKWATQRRRGSYGRPNVPIL